MKLTKQNIVKVRATLLHSIINLLNSLGNLELLTGTYVLFKSFL